MHQNTHMYGAGDAHLLCEVGHRANENFDKFKFLEVLRPLSIVSLLNVAAPLPTMPPKYIMSIHGMLRSVLSPLVEVEEADLDIDIIAVQMKLSFEQTPCIWGVLATTRTARHAKLM